MLRTVRLGRSRFLTLSSLMIGVVAACSSDDAPAPATSSTVDAGAIVDSATSSDASNNDGATSNEDASVVTGVSITSAGGTFQVGAATVTVPAGAVAADTPVTLTLSTAPPAGSGLAGAQILTDILVATPHGTTFTKPIVVDLPLKSGVNPPPSAEAWTLADDADTTWEKLGAATITSNKVRYETTHFSWSIGVYWPPAVVDGGTDSAVDGGGDGGGFVSPQCFVYSAGGSSVGATIHRAADRLYWIGAAGAAAKNVHSVKTDLTDYKKYANPGGSLGVTSNANGVFWSENFPPSDAGVSAGLYLLATSGGTPTFQASSTFTGAMTATATNVFRLAMVGVDWTLQRSDASGQNAEVLVYTTADQVEAASGYVYWINSTYAATNTFCATAGNKMPQIQRVATNATAPATAQLSVDGCAIQAITGRASEKLTRFATDGVHTYAQSDAGEIWKTPVGGGTPVRMFQPLFPNKNMGSSVAIVGSNLVFKDQDASVGSTMGMRKIPLAGGTSTLFALPYGSMLASDDAYVYFADQASVCRLAVP